MFKFITAKFSGTLNLRKYLSAFLLILMVVGTLPLLFSIGNIIAPKDPLVAKAAAGNLDPSFTNYKITGFNNSVNTNAIQTDGKIVAGGLFTFFNGTATNYIARLNANGTLDTTFTTNIGTGFNNSVNTLAIQTDGKIVAGGNFTSFNGTPTNYIARLNANGTLDTTFTTNYGTGFNSSVNALAIQTDGKILAGGVFTSFNGTMGFYITRLTGIGLTDSSFFNGGEIGITSNISTSVLQPDGKIILGGNFTSFNGIITTNRIARVNSDGTLDTTFTTNIGTGFNNIISKLALQPDGKIVVGGGFTSFNGTPTNRIARLNANGTLDTTFTTNIGTGFNNTIFALALQLDGKILAGGFISTFNGTSSNSIARLNADGTLDTTFTTNIGTGFNTFVNSIALQPDGKIVAVGQFTTFNGAATTRIARLNANGTLDTTFTTNIGTGFNSSVFAVALQPDGKIVASGQLTTFNGTASSRIARLNANGTLDTAFTTNIGTGFNSNVSSALTLQPDGKMLVGGSFTTFNGTSSNSIARLNANGTLDTTFTTNTGTGFDSSPNTITLQLDGKILAGGNFTSYNGTTAYSLVRLNGDSITLNLKVLLTGNYDTAAAKTAGFGVMNTNLNTKSLIPTSQPYNAAPFSYSGTETIGGAVGVNVVDWVLVEIRDSTRTTVIERQAALLQKDGTVLTASTQASGITLSVTPTGNYYIIIRHRNHLAISTSTASTLTLGVTTTQDFTSNTNLLGSNQTLLQTISSTSYYGMKPSNANGDRAIDASDRVAVRTGAESNNIYASKDLNLDGTVDATDREITRVASDATDGI